MVTTTATIQEWEDCSTVTGGTNYAWQSWNYYVETTTSCTTTDIVWGKWCQIDTTTMYSATTDTIWVKWNYNYWPSWEPAEVKILNNAGIIAPKQRTPEELAERARVAREAEEVYLKRAAEQNRIAREAEERAEALLKEHLDQEQLAEFAAKQYFTMATRDGKRWYRISKGAKVQQLDKPDGQVVLHRFCIHPVEHVPACDTMLVQKLLLEHDEEFFVKTANRT